MKKIIALMLCICMLLPLVACVEEQQPVTTPSTVVTDPSTAPTDPSTAPTDPSTAPTDPSTAPTNPSTAPTQPTTAPTTPPVTQPTTPPATQPTVPVGPLPQQTIEFEAEKPASKVVDTKKRTDVNGVSMDHSYRASALHTDGLHYVDSARTKIFFCAFDSYTYEFTSQEEGSYYLYIVASCDRDTPIKYSYDDVTVTGHFANNKYKSYDQIDLGLIQVVKGKNTVKLTITENKNHNVWVDKYVLIPAHIVDSEKGNYDWDPILNAKDQLEAPRTETTNAVWKELYVATNGKDTNDGSKNSPFASIPAALKKVSSLRSQMQGDIVINIASGVYTITEPIVLNANNGGINNYRVILRGDAKDKPILSGGVKVTGWSKVTGMDGVWSAPLDVVDTRTLYINDQMATRARSEYLYVGDKNYQTTSSKSDGIILTSRSFPKMTNLSDIELVFDSEWQCHRYPVANIIYGYAGSKYQIAIEMQQPYWNALYNTSKMAPNDPGYNKGFYIENAIELLDEPGEFYYNKAEKRIYYMPFAEENMTTAECYVGIYEYLLQITGTQSNMVSGVTLENLQFKYGAWLEVSEKGMLNNQADNNKNTTNRDGASIMIPGQVSVEWTKNLTVRNCVFSCLGSTALKLTEGVTDSLIDGNVFTNISGSAISIGKDNHNTSMAKAPARIDVTNNVIRRIGAEYRSCPAIIMYYVTNNRVMHNDIAHIPYTGISLGWGWGKDVKECKDNVIAYNKIVDVAWPTNDGAHIYVLSPNYTTYINNNYCSGSGDIRGGVYPDEGSAHLNIFHNVLEDMTLYWLYARPGVYLRDINAFQNYSDTDKIYIDERNVIVDDNTVITNGQWPAEAQAIINNAGVSAEYKGLLNGVELPSWHTDFGKNVPENYGS